MTSHSPAVLDGESKGEGDSDGMVQAMIRF